MGKKHTLLKELCPKRVQENSFEGGPGGASGALNYQTPYGTPQGGNYAQNPDHFGTRDMNKGPNHMDNYPTGSALAKLPERPDRQSSSQSPIHPGAMSDKGDFEQSAPEGPPGKPHFAAKDTEQEPTEVPKTDLSEPAPGAKFDQAQSKKPLNPDVGYDKDVDQMFKKKQAPSPDEIMSALQYELGQMVKKDKTIAKRKVLQNLKDNPNYYSQLDMLNIDDKKMKVDETTVSKTKSVLDEMISQRQKKLPPPTPGLDEILKDLRERRFGTKREQS